MNVVITSVRALDGQSRPADQSTCFRVLPIPKNRGALSPQFHSRQTRRSPRAAGLRRRGQQSRFVQAMCIQQCAWQAPCQPCAARSAARSSKNSQACRRSSEPVQLRVPMSISDSSFASGKLLVGFHNAIAKTAVAEPPALNTPAKPQGSPPARFSLAPGRRRTSGNIRVPSASPW